MILWDNKNKIEISEINWPLAIDLVARLGYETKPEDTEINVSNVYDITPDLSMWGIPWKFNNGKINK